tara:strand:+ start:465 stop:842 length:378 start_codon:yes stop_codon:yes gene_type:complete
MLCINFLKNIWEVPPCAFTSAKRSNTRELELKPWQVMAFMEYANEVRPTIQHKLQNHSEQLFPTNARFSSIVYHIFKKLKKYNQKAENIKQIRASVINTGRPGKIARNRQQLPSGKLNMEYKVLI